MKRADKIKKIFDIYKDELPVHKFGDSESIFYTLIKIEKITRKKNDQYEAYTTDCNAYLPIKEKYLDEILISDLKFVSISMAIDKRKKSLIRLNKMALKLKGRELDLVLESINTINKEVEQLNLKQKEHEDNFSTFKQY
jgi:hypothetical protein